MENHEKRDNIHNALDVSGFVYLVSLPHKKLSPQKMSFRNPGFETSLNQSLEPNLSDKDFNFDLDFNIDLNDPLLLNAFDFMDNPLRHGLSTGNSSIPFLMLLVLILFISAIDSSNGSDGSATNMSTHFLPPMDDSFAPTSTHFLPPVDGLSSASRSGSMPFSSSVNDSNGQVDGGPTAAVVGNTLANTSLEAGNRVFYLYFWCLTNYWY